MLCNRIILYFYIFIFNSLECNRITFNNQREERERESERERKKKQQQQQQFKKQN